jgi:hypothetical protein
MNGSGFDHDHGRIVKTKDIGLEEAMYEPEVFPGLIHRMADPKAVFLVFSTGRIVCTGAKTKEMIGQDIDKLVKVVKELGLAVTAGQDAGIEDDDFISSNRYEEILQRKNQRKSPRPTKSEGESGFHYFYLQINARLVLTAIFNDTNSVI